MVSVVWNVYLSFTGRRVTLRDVRQAFIPGVFFGVNLATFFVGATQQQRGQRGVDRFALAVPDRADRAPSSSRSTTIRVRCCSPSSLSAARPWCS